MFKYKGMYFTGKIMSVSFPPKWTNKKLCILTQAVPCMPAQQHLSLSKQYYEWFSISNTYMSWNILLSLFFLAWRISWIFLSFEVHLIVPWLLKTTCHFLPWVAVKSEPKQASRILPVRFTFAFVEPLPFFFLFFWPRKYN